MHRVSLPQIDVQIPLVQVSPLAHWLPQPPQLVGSVWMFTQILLHSAKDGVGGQAQLPPRHTFPSWQTLPQLPQLLGLKLVLMQIPPQFSSIGKQPQEPPVHRAPWGQGAPHCPQLPSSVLRSTQALLQFVSPDPHWVVHWPSLHTWLLAHCLPQSPQFAGSESVSTHCPEQAVAKGGQAQLPPRHHAPVPHCSPQPPQ